MSSVSSFRSRPCLLKSVGSRFPHVSICQERRVDNQIVQQLTRETLLFFFCFFWVQGDPAYCSEDSTTDHSCSTKEAKTKLMNGVFLLGEMWCFSQFLYGDETRGDRIFISFLAFKNTCFMNGGPLVCLTIKELSIPRELRITWAT